MTTATPIDRADLRYISIAEAARTVGMSKKRMAELWPSIPTAYRTEGGQGRVSLWGIKQWQITRSGEGNK